MIHGGKIIVAIGNTAIAASKSCDIETACEAIPVSSPLTPSSTGKWRRLIAGQKSWMVSVSNLVIGVENLLLEVGTEVTLKIYDADYPSSDYVTGSAICTAAHITATWGNLAQGAWTFEGNGELS